MKIAYLVNQYPAPTHTFIRREILGLEKLGLDVLRLTIRSHPGGDSLPDPEDRDELKKTIAVLDQGFFLISIHLLIVAVTRPVAWLRGFVLAVRLGRRSASGLLRHVAYFAEACTAVRLLRRESVEHVHAHFGTNPAMVAMLTRVLGGPPYSFMIHGPDEFDSPRLLHLREKVARAAFVTTISHFAKSQTYRWSDPADWKKVHVVRCGVDESFLEYPCPPVPDACRLVCVGRLAPSKGHVLLIQAAARLVEEGLNFETILVGDGPLRTLLEKQIEAHRLQETVKLRGWLSQEEVRQTVLSSRALVLPSFAEGLPVVIMEALALARPVIGTRIAGIPELLEDRVNGWLITSGSLEELIDALREALQAPVDRLSSMGEAGRQAVIVKHNAHREAETLLKILRAYHKESPQPQPLQTRS